MFHTRKPESSSHNVDNGVTHEEARAYLAWAKMPLDVGQAFEILEKSPHKLREIREQLRARHEQD